MTNKQNLLYKLADILGVLVPLEWETGTSFEQKIEILLERHKKMCNPKYDYMEWYTEDYAEELLCDENLADGDFCGGDVSVDFTLDNFNKQ